MHFGIRGHDTARRRQLAGPLSGVAAGVAPLWDLGAALRNAVAGGFRTLEAFRLTVSQIGREVHRDRPVLQGFSRRGNDVRSPWVDFALLWKEFERQWRQCPRLWRHIEGRWPNFPER